MAFYHYPNHFGTPDNDSSMTDSPTHSYAASTGAHSSIAPFTSTVSYSTLFPSLPNSPSHQQAPQFGLPPPLPSLTQPFPTPLPAPSLPIRLRPHSSALASLDAEISQKDEEEGLPPVLDESRMVARGRIEALDDEDEMSLFGARCALDEFTKMRTPFVGLASERLQAVVGERNAGVFDLPEIPLTHTPFLHRLSPNPSGHTNSLAPSFSPRICPTSSNTNSRKDSGVGLPLRSPLSPLSPFEFGKVDEKTGKGLREWLLSRGKETGTQRKRECRSISLHDFTPDMRTGTHADVLVAHYNGGGLHERADVYEVDLPMTYIDPNTNQPTQGTQTWLWFLISRPLISLSPTETNTDPTPEGDPEHWDRLLTHKSKPPKVIRPPPDFPMPIPTSYVVFACPASNVTAYPDCKDDAAPFLPALTSYHHALAPSYLTSQNRSRPRSESTYSSFSPDLAANPPKKIYKRKDYDFSFQGVPLFEFSSSSLTSPQLTIPGRAPFTILSVDNLGSWYPYDIYGSCNISEYRLRVQKWEAELENVSAGEKKVDEMEARDRYMERPSTTMGVWWEGFYREVYREESRWRRIREAMARGKCRIVVRWEEYETSPVLAASSGQGARKKLKMSPNLGLSGDEASADEEGGESPGVGLGLDFNFGYENSEGGMGSHSGNANGSNAPNAVSRPDIKHPKPRRSFSGQARVTRSVSRRKSGLGVVTTSQEGMNAAMVAQSGFDGVLIGVGREAGGAGFGGGDDAGSDNGGMMGAVTAGDGGVVKEKRRKK